MLPYTSLKLAMVTAERLRQTIATHSFLFTDAKGPRSITASMGVASYPSHGASVEELIRKADEALYDAKRKGKNCVCASSDSPTGEGLPGGDPITRMNRGVPHEQREY